MTTTSTLQYLDCARCGPHSLHDYNVCRQCKHPFSAPITHPDLRRWNNQGAQATAERNRRRSKAAVKRALTGPRGKSWAQRYEVDL